MVIGLITSHLPITAWHNAILYRIIHNVYHLELEDMFTRKDIAKMDDEMP